MSDYQQIADAIRTTFLADPWLGNTANVKTIETHRRGFSIADKPSALFFKPAELPAIAVNPNASPKQSSQETTNEIRSVVRAEIDAVTRARGAQAGLATHQTLVGNIERVLEKQKTSVDDLGIGAFVANVATVQEDPVKDGEYHVFISRTTCDVDITTSI